MGNPVRIGNGPATVSKKFNSSWSIGTHSSKSENLSASINPNQKGEGTLRERALSLRALSGPF